MRSTLIIISLLFFSTVANAAGNNVVNSYNDAKRLLYGVVYADHRVTLYCGARYDRDRNVELPLGFVILAHEERAYRAETEHIVAAENFGRAFQEWRVGAPQCVDGRGRVYKGRKCAETNEEFRFMEADLHNLAPAIGAVNAARRNYRFGIVSPDVPTWGTCSMRISDRIVEPPDDVKGMIARTHLYFAEAYPSRYRLSRAQQNLFEAWDRQFEVGCKK